MPIPFDWFEADACKVQSPLALFHRAPVCALLSGHTHRKASSLLRISEFGLLSDFGL
jgi:hypothetical protein